MTDQSDYDAEQSIIQTFVTRPECREAILGRLTLDHFVEGRHMYERVTSIHKAGENPVGEWAAEPPANFTHIPWMAAADRLENLSQRREMAIEARLLADMTSDMGVSVDTIKGRFCTFSGVLDTRASSADELPTREEILARTLADLKKIKETGRGAVPWGMDGLDILPLEAGNLITLAARPSVGKTAMAVSCMRQQSLRGVKAGLICFEMGDEQLAVRCLSMDANISYADIRHGNLGVTGQPAMDHAVGIFPTHNYEIHARRRRLTTREIERIVSSWVRDRDVRVVYIDYLQLVEHECGAREPMRLAVGRTIRNLKEIAGKYGIPIVVLAQLNRDAQNVKPNIGNLKETGEIEEHSDGIVLLDRNHNPQEPCERKYSITRVDGSQALVDMTAGDVAAAIIAKNRNGATGVKLLSFDATTMQYQRFV